MPNIKLIIEYDGTDFHGWQIQPGGQRTVQGIIRDTYREVFKEHINLIGSGRTDSGVHARAQVGNFCTKLLKPADEIRNALNAHLPDDVVILKATKVADTFHAQYDAKQKTYRYQILNRDTRSPIHSRNTLLYPHALDVDSMKKGAQILVGKHDFEAFKGNNRSNQGGSNVRTISQLRVHKKGALIIVDITADGFMYKMVRNIVGALLACGNGRISLSELRRILRSKDRKLAPAAVSAHGLTLWQVKYRN